MTKQEDGALLSDPGEAQKESDSNQYGIAALFWATFVVGLGLAYLQRLESPDIMIDAAIAIPIALLIGAIIGLVTGNMKDALFWSTLVAAFAYISTASDPVYGSYHRFAWTVVGGITGGLAATVGIGKAWLNGLSCAIAAISAMGIYYYLQSQFGSGVDAQIDLWISPFIGVCVSAFVGIILWLESKQKMPRYVTATWLMVAVIAGNLAVP